MYQVENAGDLLRNRRAALRAALWPQVGANFFLLGLTSLLTDISVEMVTTTLPLFVLFDLHPAPLQFGFIDGLRQSAAAWCNWRAASCPTADSDPRPLFARHATSPPVVRSSGIPGHE